MAIPTNVVQTYDLAGNREDLSDVIYNVDPYDTPILSMIAKVKAASTKHEWQTDALAAATSATVVEGATASGAALTSTTRLFNYTAIQERTVVVSGSQEAVVSAGRPSEAGYQIAKKIKEIKKSIELQLSFTTAGAVGDSDSAREMAGLCTWIATNDVFGASGVSSAGNGTDTRTDGTQRAFTEAQFKACLALCYASGGDPDMVSLGAFNKQKFSMFSGGASRFDKAEDARLVATVDIYKSDFGELKIVPNRHQRSRDGWVLDTSMWAFAELRPLRKQLLAITGDSRSYQLLCEGTLVSRNEKASGMVADLTTS
jgi:hypothetical protein